MTIQRLGVIAFLAAFLGGGILLAVRSCDTKPTKTEGRADSVLASVPAWQDSARVKDSLLTISRQAHAKMARQSAAQRLRADSAEAKADFLQAWADGLAEVPTNLSPGEQNVQLRTALAAQIRASVQFQVTVGALKAQRVTDSLRLVGADSMIAQLQQWRGEDRDRLDGVTRTLADLRAETKRRASAKFLGFLPPWVDEALMVTGTAVVAYKVGQGTRARS